AKAVLEGGKADAEIGPGELNITVGDKQASVRLGVKASAGDDAVNAALDAALVKQDIYPDLPPVKELASVEAAVAFRTADKRTDVALKPIRAVDGAIDALVKMQLIDTDDAGVRPAGTFVGADIDLKALARVAAPIVGPIDVEATPFHLATHDLEVSPALRGDATLHGSIARLSFRDMEVKNLTVDAKLAQADGKAHVEAHLPLEHAKLPGLEVAGVDAALTADGPAGGYPLAVGGKVHVATVDAGANGATD